MTRMTWDENAGAIYVYAIDGYEGPVQTATLFEDAVSVNIDRAPDGRLIGIEVYGIDSLATLDAARAGAGLDDPEPIANETESGYARRRELVAAARAAAPAPALREALAKQLHDWLCDGPHMASIETATDEEVREVGRCDLVAARSLAAAAPVAEGLPSVVRHWRTSAGFTLRAAAERVTADFTYLSKIENGHDWPSRRLAAELDRVYHADGAIVAAWEASRCPTCGGPR